MLLGSDALCREAGYVGRSLGAQGYSPARVESHRVERQATGLSASAPDAEWFCVAGGRMTPSVSTPAVIGLPRRWSLRGARLGSTSFVLAALRALHVDTALRAA
ncbi:MAG TPA: hypothetical protein VKP64_06695, partial [Mycobacteriales bacterium]|nr:hypothetical protein [Mycobacteriales bacterium]